VIGCQCVRLGSGELIVTDTNTTNYFANNSIINNSLALYDQAVDYYQQAYLAYLANQSYTYLLANYTSLLNDASRPIEELVLTNLICNVTGGLPESVCAQ